MTNFIIINVTFDGNNENIIDQQKEKINEKKDKKKEQHIKRKYK